MMKKIKTNKGITLVALVITIIVLLILAVVSISIVINQGIIDKSQDAANTHQKEAEQEAIQIGYSEYLNDKYSGTTPLELKVADAKTEGNETKGWSVEFSKTGNIYSVSSDGKSIELDTVQMEWKSAETITDTKTNKVLSETENIKLKDEYGNKIVVPAGFKIKVEPDTNNATHVTEGIVVTDGTNEFVWIPVGNIKKSKEDTTGTPITLGRYVFKEDGTIDETLSQTAPDAQLKASSGSSNYFKEGEIEGIAVDSNGKATKGYAKDINAFISSANNNGGYYLGRYEARTATERKANEYELTTVTENKNDYVYNYVTQLQATKRCQNMYTGKPFTSDLINSYAWDTAILFIQTFGGNSTYSRKNSVNTSTDGLAKKGTESDKERNIYDMASNCFEWSTETYSNSSNPCTNRGGFYLNSKSYTSNRNKLNKTASGVGISFRPLLYV